MHLAFNRSHCGHYYGPEYCHDPATTLRLCHLSIVCIFLYTRLYLGTTRQTGEILVTYISACPDPTCLTVSSIEGWLLCGLQILICRQSLSGWPRLYGEPTFSEAEAARYAWWMENEVGYHAFCVTGNDKTWMLTTTLARPCDLVSMGGPKYPPR